MNFYDNTFYKPEHLQAFKAHNYGPLEKEVSNFNWEHRLDEFHFDNSEPGDPDMYATMADYEADKRWFAKMLKKPHRTTQLNEPIGEATEFYSFKNGAVWLGEIKQ